MIETAGGSEFLLKALEQDRIAGRLRRHDLDGHDLAGVALAGLVDRPHAPFGDLFQKIIITHGFHGNLRGVKPHRRGLPWPNLKRALPAPPWKCNSWIARLLGIQGKLPKQSRVSSIPQEKGGTASL